MAHRHVCVCVLIISCETGLFLIELLDQSPIKKRLWLIILRSFSKKNKSQILCFFFVNVSLIDIF